MEVLLSSASLETWLTLRITWVSNQPSMSVWSMSFQIMCEQLTSESRWHPQVLKPRHWCNSPGSPQVKKNKAVLRLWTLRDLVKIWTTQSFWVGEVIQLQLGHHPEVCMPSVISLSAQLCWAETQHAQRQPHTNLTCIYWIFPCLI